MENPAEPISEKSEFSEINMDKPAGAVSEESEGTVHNKRKRFSLLKFISDIVFLMLFIVFLVLLYFSLASGDSDANGASFGPYKALNILTGSMSPTINIGDLIVIGNVDSEELEVGDVITFFPVQNNASILVTHRIVGNNKDAREFITRGDANNSNDTNPVPYEMVLGVVLFTVPFAGKVAVFLRSPAGIAVIVVIFLFITVIPRFLKVFFQNEPKDANKYNK